MTLVRDIRALVGKVEVGDVAGELARNPSAGVSFANSSVAAAVLRGIGFTIRGTYVAPSKKTVKKGADDSEAPKPKDDKPKDAPKDDKAPPAPKKDAPPAPPAAPKAPTPPKPPTPPTAPKPPASPKPVAPPAPPENPLISKLKLLAPEDQQQVVDLIEQLGKVKSNPLDVFSSAEDDFLDGPDV